MALDLGADYEYSSYLGGLPPRYFEKLEKPEYKDFLIQMVELGLKLSERDSISREAYFASSKGVCLLEVISETQRYMSGELASSVAAILKYVGPNQNILDFGCGVGAVGLYIAEVGFRKVDFLEINEYSTSFLQWRLVKRMMEKSSKIWTKIQDMPGVKYDWILAINTFEYLSDGELRACLIMLDRMLTGEGGIILSEPKGNLPDFACKPNDEREQLIHDFCMKHKHALI